LPHFPLNERLTRRDFLARATVAAGAVALGCTDSTDPEPTEGTLDHIIVVTMENRSFNHLLGWVPGADGRQSGLSYLDASGVSHPTFRLPTLHSCNYADPNHSFEGGRLEYNNGACDGWLRTPGNDLHAISYYQAADLPFLGKAAPEWLVLDRYFTPLMGPTYPNRVLSLAAETDRLSNTLVASTLPTIWDRLFAAGLSGKNYGTNLVSSSLWGTRYVSIIRPISEFYSDAAAGNLPNLSFVDPDFGSPTSNSYHPPEDIRNAEAFLGRVYQAVTKSPQWGKSLLVITFDEWGGFFDHVPPPVAQVPQAEKNLGNIDGLRGFRIPTVLVSPFVKRKNVSSKVYDHSSVLRMIETRWNLQPLTIRDATANDLMDEIDLGIPVTAAPVIDVPQGPFVTPC
jgi:phospholipase C